MTAPEYRKRKNKYIIASMVLMAGTLLFYIVYGYVKGLTGAKDDSLIKELMLKLIPYGLTAVGLLIACIFISNKLRTTVWMASTIIGTLIFGRYALIATFVLWAFDEYVLFRLYNKYKLRQEMAIVRDEVKR